MATINIKTNLTEVGDRLVEKLKKLQDREYLLRPVCVDLIDLMTKRIHIDGKASDGGDIGTYSHGYLKQRQRKPYNRTSDSKIIVSLTRQLENDWSLIATKTGYGIGFKNSFNMKKARWVEQIKDKVIFHMTTGEFNYAKERLNELVNQAMK